MFGLSHKGVMRVLQFCFVDRTLIVKVLIATKESLLSVTYFGRKGSLSSRNKDLSLREKVNEV